MAVTRHTSQRITLLMLVLASVTILTLDYHGEASRAISRARSGVASGLAPLQRAVAATVHPLGDMGSAIFHYGQLQTDNAELQRELGTLERENAAAGYASSIEKEYSILGSLPFAGNIPSLPAEVISQATSNFQQTLEIDRGTSSGVGKGMPVVGSNGLVGSVISASGGVSTVLLITDDTKSGATEVGVEDPKTGGLYQVAGSGAGKTLALSSYGSSTGSPSVGTVLETAGQTDGASAAQFPAGIPVGKVSSSESAAAGLQVSGTVVPMVDLSTLTYVSVLQWLPPA